MTIVLPKQFAHIARTPLLYPHPSPTHPLEALTVALNPNPSQTTTKSSNSNSNSNSNSRPRVSLYAKREDHSSPLACAGNKYRKLEYIVPDILNPDPGITGAPDTPENSINGGPTASGNVTTVVTEGAVQSNHTIQVNAVANKLGLEYAGVTDRMTGQGYKEARNKDVFVNVGNPQMSRLLQSSSPPSSTGPIEDRNTTTATSDNDNMDPANQVLNELHKRKKVPYWIPSGASLHPLGGLGYARCAFEIASQEHFQSSSSSTGRFDYVFAACGSGSTVGGLIAGFKLLEKLAPSSSSTRLPPRKVIGVLNSPTKPRSYHEERVLRFARNTGRLIGLEDPESEITMADVHLDDRFVGSAYGSVNPETKKYLCLMAEMESIILDPVYTAKVAWGLAMWVEDGQLVKDWKSRCQDLGISGIKDVNALFMHTGGQAALPAYSDRI